MRSWAIRRQPRSTIRCRGPRQHERSSRPGVGCRCARPPPGSPLRSDPAARGACGDLDPVSAHRRKAVTGRRHRPAPLVAGHDYDENRPSRLHLSNARFWSEEWGPPPRIVPTPRGIGMTVVRSRMSREAHVRSLWGAGGESPPAYPACARHGAQRRVWRCQPEGESRPGSDLRVQVPWRP